MVTTRKRTASAAPAKKAAATPKKPAAKRSAKKAPVAQESASESESEDKDTEDQELSELSSGDSEDEDEDSNHSDEEDNDNEKEEEDTFKIHTPKATSAPKVVPAALPTVTYEDDSEEEDSDAAPEAESLSSAKAKILSAQDKEKNFLSKVQAEQKAKRVEREQKLKEQKDSSKKKTVKVQDSAKPKVDESAAVSEPTTTRSGLPTMLPMDILESVATMDDQESNAPGTVSNEKKRKHMRPEDFALMELEAELRAEAQKRKKTEKTQKNVGPVTVKVLDQSKLAKGHAVPETIVDFRKQHFYGSKIQRKDAVLNNSQRNAGAASKFNRRK
ncbi:hypothetical protein BGZ70_008399 [Mortierella alpina]|uniref:Uncharacterized protein n=1 Tax=Mortierella alpina TaxID=64518 RepID=A0A9P6JDL8_MORAP|nr:hypothetical protein BGZ70_008399 [Mortierella alpina]